MNRQSTEPVTATSSQQSEPKKPERETKVVPTAPPVARAPEPEPARPVEAEPTLAVTRIAQPPPIVERPATAKLQYIGETAVLFDADGKPLLKATPVNPIFSAKPSPTGQQILVSSGNGIHRIYSINPFRLVRELPLTPKDIPRASAFSPWDWIDETTLITSADVERPAADLTGLTGAERESSENTRERTLLYSFNLTKGTLARIDTAKAGLPPSFTVVEMHSGGRVKVEWDENGTARTAWVSASGK
jgi:hypothetical protein